MSNLKNKIVKKIALWISLQTQFDLGRNVTTDKITNNKAR